MNVRIGNMGSGPLAPDPSEHRVYRGEQLLALPQVARLPEEELAAMRLVSKVLPFKVNGYVLKNLIDWDAVPDDPIFKLVFPNSQMLDPDQLKRLAKADASSRQQVALSATRLRPDLDLDASSQQLLNVPSINGSVVSGLQHKYPHTLLVFPSKGQTCHSYCGYCFRWPQFIENGSRHSLTDPNVMVDYIKAHPEVTDVLLTGGDPLIMKTDVLQQWIDPILQRCPGIRNVRLGTKALSFWPYRFTTDSDASDLLRTFDRVMGSGRSLNVMAHVSHPRELAPPVVRSAIRRIAATGATVRTQAPLVRGVNDDPGVWAEMWTDQVRLGMAPYYMFVDRPTGAHRYYAVTLSRAIDIYREASAQVSGLARTARGPVMSTSEGKVVLEGLVTLRDRTSFVTRFAQCRDIARVGEINLYDYDPDATWFDALRPTK